MPEDFPVTIYHNPACGTSRSTLATLRETGLPLTVVEYLKTGWTRPQLSELLAAMGARPRAILREKEAPVAGIGPEATDEQILDAMVAHPILVNRPIVVTPKGTKLTRPTELVGSLLP